jgi:hypothetical protein
MYDILSGISSGLEIAGAQFSMIRIFAVWGGDVDLERTVPPQARTLAGRISARISLRRTEDQNENDIDTHPIASLQRKTFAKISEEADKGWLLEKIGKIFSSFKRQRDEDSEESLPSPKRMRLEE